MAVQPEVRRTGGQIDEMTWAVIEAANDKDLTVQKQMITTLQCVGQKQPCLVLSSCHSYFLKHVKLSPGHRVVLFNVMEGVFKNSSVKIEKQLIMQIIELTSNEMTQSKESGSELQKSASRVLIAMGNRYCIDVMENLLVKFQPGVLPHFAIVETMAYLASENVFEMVPFIKVVIGSMLPMLGMCKQEHMKWIFSFALAKFCESIMDYVANIEKAPDKNVTAAAFSAEVDSSYDVLFHVWLSSKDAKLRLTIVEAIGNMSHIMSNSKLQAELPKLISGILGLYKKHHEVLPITAGLCMVLEACSSNEKMIIDPLLDNILAVLFPQVHQPFDYNNPMSLKNHNEILRCFAVLNNTFSDHIISYLLEKLDNNQEKVRIGALNVIRHLVNTGGDHMEDKKGLLLSGLKMLLHNQSNKVNKILAQVIIAMAHHQYLELEGGKLMLEFVVRQCHLPSDTNTKHSSDPEYVSNNALRSMCENVLQLLSSTIENLDDVLWPALLEYIVPSCYYRALGCICKNIVVIAEGKDKEDLVIHFHQHADLPKPCALLARLMVVAGVPEFESNRASHVLKCLTAISSNLHVNIVTLCESVIPKLLKFLEEQKQMEEEDWPVKKWEDLILKTLSKLLDEIGDEAWCIELGKEMVQQIQLYETYPQEKSFLYKCMGVVMRKTGKTECVNANLDAIFHSIKHSSQVEREGCAMAVGYSGTSHIDTVLSKLESISKFDGTKRSSGLLSFIKDSVGMKAEVEEQTRATIILCYGYVILFGPKDLVTSRLETTVMRNLLPQFTSVKEHVLKYNLIATVGLLGEAMHPDNLGSTYTFTHKKDLLTYMLNYLNAETQIDIKNTTRSCLLRTCATLVKLDPDLSDMEVHDLLTAAFLSVMSLPLHSYDFKKAKEESFREVLVNENLVKSTVLSLKYLVHEVVIKDSSPESIKNVIEHLSPWLSSNEAFERERAMLIIDSTLNLYICDILPKKRHAVKFTTLGSILGILIARCTDPVLEVRKLAIDCITTTLKISAYDDVVSDSDHLLEALPTLKEKLETTEPNSLFSAVKDLSKIICKKTPSSEIVALVKALAVGLTDPHIQSSSGVCVVLNVVIKSRGAELAPQVEDLFNEVHCKLKLIKNQQPRTGALRSIRILAMHHFSTVMSLMLKQPLPITQHTCDCWAVFAQEKDFSKQIVEHILDILQRSKPYDEKTDSSFMSKDTVVKVATFLPIAGSCALTEIFRAEEAKEIAEELFAKLLGALLLRVASSVGTKAPRVSKAEIDKKSGLETGRTLNRELEVNPSDAAISCLQQLFICLGQQQLIENMAAEEVWINLKDEVLYPEAFGAIARCLCDNKPESVVKVVSYLNPSLSSPYEPERIMVTSFFAELINNKCGSDLTTVELLVNSLLSKLVDSSLDVRRFCIRGLGNVANIGSEQVHKFSTTMLSAMMAGMDDKDDKDDLVTLEAMNGLSKILKTIQEEDIHSILINIALRIRPCFEKDLETVRTSAFVLFGNLANFGNGPAKDTFLEQVHSNLVAILLHLNDCNDEVKKACKTTLKQLGPLLGSDNLDNMFQKHLIDSAGLIYGEFMNDLSKILVQDFSDKLNFYIMSCVNFYKSTWWEMRSNAAMFTGFLLGNAPVDSYSNISKEHVCGALILLLRDTSPKVKIYAAEAISLMHDI